MIDQTNVHICMFNNKWFYADLKENFLTTRISHLATDKTDCFAARKIKQLNQLPSKAVCSFLFLSVRQALFSTWR